MKMCGIILVITNLIKTTNDKNGNYCRMPSSDDGNAYAIFNPNKNEGEVFK